MSHKGGTLQVHWSKFKPTMFRIKRFWPGGSPSLFRRALVQLVHCPERSSRCLWRLLLLPHVHRLPGLSFLRSAAMVALGQGYQPVVALIMAQKFIDG